MGRPRALTAEQALEAVADAHRGITQERIAQRFAVSSELISRIVTGVSYSDVTGIRRTFGTAPGQEPCCADSRCRRCELVAVQARNLAEVRAFQTFVACAGCGQAITRRIGVVLNARGMARCRTCPPVRVPRRHRCWADEPCERCRIEKVCEHNLELVRAAEVDVRCAGCGSTITRAAGLILSAHGRASCRTCRRRAR